MNRKTATILLIVFSVILVGELVLVGVLNQKAPDISDTVQTNAPATQPAQTALPSEAMPTAPRESEVATSLPQETEPDQDRYVLTFAGDCTLGSTAEKAGSSSSFITTIGTNYDYPFENVAEYFENDDFTIVNLEGPLTQTGTAAAKTFAFKGPTAYTQILTGSSVEAVTLANNHAEDYGKEGYQSTVNALESASVAYVEKNKTTLYETESGLKIGLYAASFEFNKSNMASSITALRNSGAEIVICAFHWGTEGAYRPTSNQEYFGHAAIEAGADIVYGSHPHVLQKIEEYKGGYIFYSMGNFSFGGSTFPQDYDSAILQVEVLRQENGSVKLGQLTRIPVSCSSVNSYNNYQPTPYKEGSKEYDRVLSKLDGSFTGADLVVDYGKLNGNTATEPSTGEATEPADPGTDPTTSAPDVQPTAPVTSPEPTTAPGGSDTTGGTAGGDTSGSTTTGTPSDGTPSDGASSEGTPSGGSDSGDASNSGSAAPDAGSAAPDSGSAEPAE